ncbi:MAG: SusC/RagA family TonB-linked outer membrane protein [Bacteroidales bacterium]|nr:SusC/RagA family TonB-linked outer membrane protein [Bacteroidales bacterium]
MRKFTLLLAFLIFAGMQVVLAQQKVVKGKVTSSDDGQGIPGVTVLVKGTTIGTTSLVDGAYELSFDARHNVLVFSYVGMKTQEVTVGDKTTLDVALEPDVLNIEGAVVTAIGIKRETKALGYSVTEVGNEEINRTQNTNVVNALSGKVAGVQVVNSSGAAGAASFITVRGVASILGENQPLFVVDGVPINNDQSYSGNPDDADNNLLDGVAYSNRAIDLNPEDIESMSVLKGGAATALYGVRAANGAIIITTKKGASTPGRKIVANLHSSVSFDQVNQFPELQDKYSQGYDFGDGPEYLGPETGWPASWGPAISSLEYDGDATYKWDRWGALVPKGTGNGKALEAYDNAGDFFRTGVTYNNSLNLSGGSDKATYYFSIGDVSSQSIIPNNKYRKTSVKIAGSSNISDKIKASGSINFIKSGGDRIQQGSNLSGVMLGLVRTPPSFDNSNHYEDAADEPLAYSFPDGRQRNYRGGGGYDNPYWTINKNILTDNVNRMIGNATFDYMPFEWMTITYRLGNDFYSDRRDYSIAKYSRAYPDGQVTDDNHFVSDINADLLLNVRRQLTEDLDFTFTLGHNMFQHYYKQQYQQGDGLSILDFYHISNAKSVIARTNIEKFRTAAIYGDIGLGYRSMLYLNITARNEWTTTLPEDNNSFFYPSFSGGFVFTELPGLQDNTILPFGKIRASYAMVGNFADPYKTLSYYQSTTTGDGWTAGLAFPYMGIPGFELQGTITDPELQHESLKAFEIGLDLRFLDNRIGLDFSYYNNQHEDLLLDVPIASSTGYQVFYTNAGSMENKGIEVLARGTPVKTKDFNWDLLVNFSKNTNEVLELAEGVENVYVGGFTDPQIRAVVGKSYGYIYGTKFLYDDAGNYIIQDDPSAPNFGYPISDYEVGEIGPTLPDWIMGITNDFRYKSISLSFLFDIRQGGNIWNGTRGAMYYFGTHKDTENRDETKVFEGSYGHIGADGSIYHYDAAGNEVAGPGGSNSTSVPLGQAWYIDGEGSGFTGPADQFIEEINWVRLRELSLSYRFNPELFSKTFIRDLSIYFAGRNLLLFTDYTGIDPETSLYGSHNSQGMDYFNMPGTRTYTVGLKASF